MARAKEVKNIDKGSYNASSEDFIPVACHYDKHTLLTKNGELVQTFQINGINSDNISKTLFNLREVVRSAIKENVQCNNFAFWIHTIRRKANLDDDTPYNSFFAANVHDIWRKKNYWHDKFVNRLYVSVVHDAPEMHLRDFNSMVNSLSREVIAKFEENFHVKAAERLGETVDKMIEHLSEYGALKLGIRIVEGECFSDQMFLYRRIMQLNEKECHVPISDISTTLSSHQYAVGTDMIEVIGAEGKKFASVMSIKEYREVSSDALDRFLQIPVEMVATEVFYFVPKTKVAPVFEEQNYLLGVSKDTELRELKGLDRIVEGLEEEGNKFCHQQISFTVIGDDIKELESKINQASRALAKIGIVHVREDINLEKCFWSQLPGNFSFLSRMKPTILENTAALASLHNFPTGNQYSPWGRALTLLRTEKGTPYFANFHDQDGKTFTAIFGTRNSGKTTLMNFLLSEADKYEPTILHLVDDLDSGLFVKACGGKWYQREKEIINPFLVEDNEETRKELVEFLKIISNHYYDPLKEASEGLLSVLVDRAFKMPEEKRLLSKIIESIKDSEKGGKSLKERLKDFLPEGAYYQVFERPKKVPFKEGAFVTFSLKHYDDYVFTKENYPKEKKLIEQFEHDLNAMRAVKAGVVYAVSRMFSRISSGAPKILAIDNLNEMFNTKTYGHLLHQMNSEMLESNGVLFVAASIDTMRKNHKEGVAQDWVDSVATSYILPPELSMPSLREFLKIDKTEYKKLYSLSPAARTFLIGQDGKMIASELSIGGLPGLTRIFSSRKREREAYKKIVEKTGNKPEDWAPDLYDKLDTTL